MINIAGWEQVATLVKTRGKRIQDTYRIYVNELGWCKGRSDKTGVSKVFSSLNELNDKVNALYQNRYSLDTGALPERVVSQYAAYTEEI